MLITPVHQYPEASTFQHSSCPQSSFYLSPVKANNSLSLPKQPLQWAARASQVTKLTNSFQTQAFTSTTTAVATLGPSFVLLVHHCWLRTAVCQPSSGGLTDCRDPPAGCWVITITSDDHSMSHSSFKATSRTPTCYSDETITSFCDSDECVCALFSWTLFRNTDSKLRRSYFFFILSQINYGFNRNFLKTVDLFGWPVIWMLQHYTS